MPTVCRNIHTMKNFQQFVCRVCLCGFLPLLFGVSVQAVPLSAPANPVKAGQDAQIAADALIETAVLGWATHQAGVPASAVSMIPLDPRLKLKPCSQVLQIDTPFGSLETVRVRCAEPAWQVYVRLSYKDGLKSAQAAPEQPRPAEPKRKVLVLTSTLPRGTSLTPDMVQLVEMDLAVAGPQALERLVDLEHMELARGLGSGAPIRSFDLRPVVLVKKGQNVMMQLGQGRGFNITARLEAIQDGRMGEQIRLKNPESGRLVSAVVVGHSAVKGL
jgi:flagella basal body P-ring formation protein FlgA